LQQKNTKTQSHELAKIGARMCPNEMGQVGCQAQQCLTFVFFSNYFLKLILFLYGFFL